MEGPFDILFFPSPLFVFLPPLPKLSNTEKEKKRIEEREKKKSERAACSSDHGGKLPVWGFIPQRKEEEEKQKATWVVGFRDTGYGILYRVFRLGLFLLFLLRLSARGVKEEVNLYGMDAPEWKMERRSGQWVMLLLLLKKRESGEP